MREVLSNVKEKSFRPSVTIVIRGKVRGSTFIVAQDLQTNVVCDRAKQRGQRCYALVKSTRSYLRSSTMEGLLQVVMYKREQGAIRRKRSER